VSLTVGINITKSCIGKGKEEVGSGLEEEKASSTNNEEESAEEASLSSSCRRTKGEGQ
jgi:hypothetical protein